MPNQNPKNAKKWKEARYIYKCLHESSNRIGSMENCLSRLSTRDCQIGKFVFIRGIIAEFRIIDRSLKIDEHLLRFYNCFPNAKENKVDSRLILCTYLSFVLSEKVYENPQQILIIFFNIFASKVISSSSRNIKDNCIIYDDKKNESVLIQRSHLLNLISIASITEKDYYETHVYLDNIIPKEINLIKKENLIDILQKKPKLLQKFKDQIFAQLHDETRLDILKKREQNAFVRFEKQVNKIRLQHVIQNWKYESLTYTFRKWKKYKENRIREKWINCWLSCWSTKLHLKKWKNYTEVNIYYQYHLKRLKIKRTQNQLKWVFHRWLSSVIISKKLIRVYKFDQKCKIINTGLRKLLQTWLTFKSRRILYHWCSLTRMKVLIEVSHDFYTKRKLNSVICAFQQNVKQNALQRKHELEAANQQAWLMNAMTEIDTEIKTMKTLEDEVHIKEKQQDEIMSRQRKLADSHAKESLKCSIEKEQVRKQIQAKKFINLVLWERKWSRKKKDIEKITLQKVNKWLKSNDAKEIILKKFKELQRECSLIDDDGNVDNGNDASSAINEREQFLRSDANTCLSILDGKLSYNGFVREDFLRRLLDTTVSDDVVDDESKAIISITDFTRTVQSMLGENDESTCSSSTVISSSTNSSYSSTILIKKLFNEIGEGRRKEQIPITTICARFECTNKHNGTEGSPWKKYISPAHDIMIFHNVVSGQRYFDYEVTKKQLKAIVLDDCRFGALVKERRIILKMKREDLRLQTKILSVNIIQRAFRRRCSEMSVGNKTLDKSLYKFLT